MGGIHSNSPALQKRAGGIRVHYAVPPTPPERRVREPWVPGALVAYLHRHGAAGARGAHNSEDTGSRPVAGILFAGARADLFSKKMKWGTNVVPLIFYMTGSTVSHSFPVSAPWVYPLRYIAQWGARRAW